MVWFSFESWNSSGLSLDNLEFMPFRTLLRVSRLLHRFLKGYILNMGRTQRTCIIISNWFITYEWPVYSFGRRFVKAISSNENELLIENIWLEDVPILPLQASLLFSAWLNHFCNINALHYYTIINNSKVNCIKEEGIFNRSLDPLEGKESMERSEMRH